MLRGIDPQSAPAVLSMLRQMRSGSAADLEREGTPGLIIGEELAKRLGLGMGSRVNLEIDMLARYCERMLSYQNTV